MTTNQRPPKDSQYDSHRNDAFNDVPLTLLLVQKRGNSQMGIKPVLTGTLPALWVQMAAVSHCCSTTLFR